MSEPHSASGWEVTQRVLKALVTPVTLLALLAVLLYGAWWGYKSFTAEPPAPEPTPCVTQSATVLKSADVSVRVLNGGFTSGLAGKVSANLKAKGFKILRVGNTDERIKATVIVGKDAESPEVKLLTALFPKSEARPDGRVDGTVDVLVGSEFAGIDDKAPVEIAVPGGSVCLPASPSPSPVPSPAPSPAATTQPS